MIRDSIAFLRAASRARKYECLACTNCVYDMRNAGEAGACPECGHPWSAEEATRAWRKFLYPKEESD